MKAIVYENYGSPEVLQLTQVAKPVPKDNEVLIRVRAASINYADWVLLRGTPFLVRFESGLLKPKNNILGADVAGQVEAVGKDIKQFKPGDEVFGDLSGCGWGALAEYAVAPESVLSLKPANMSFEQAAAVPMAAVTALQGLRDTGQVRAGQKVLINGASGGVGTFAVQIAKAYGAQVTAVCSPRNLETARAIGADRVIDYTQENFTQNGYRYDLIVGANGQHSLSDYKRVLTPTGMYVCTGGTLPQVFEALLLGSIMSLNSPQKLTSMGVARPSQKDLEVMKDLLETGKVKPVIDRCYPLEAAPDAFRYLGQGHAKGKVIIEVNQERKG